MRPENASLGQQESALTCRAALRTLDHMDCWAHTTACWPFPRCPGCGVSVGGPPIGDVRSLWCIMHRLHWAHHALCAITTAFALDKGTRGRASVRHAHATSRQRVSASEYQCYVERQSRRCVCPWQAVPVLSVLSRPHGCAKRPCLEVLRVAKPMAQSQWLVLARALSDRWRKTRGAARRWPGHWTVEDVDHVQGARRTTASHATGPQARAPVSVCSMPSRCCFPVVRIVLCSPAVLPGRPAPHAPNAHTPHRPSHQGTAITTRCSRTVLFPSAGAPVLLCPAPRAVTSSRPYAWCRAFDARALIDSLAEPVRAQRPNTTLPSGPTSTVQLSVQRICFARALRPRADNNRVDRAVAGSERRMPACSPARPRQLCDPAPSRRARWVSSATLSPCSAARRRLCRRHARHSHTI